MLRLGIVKNSGDLFMLDPEDFRKHACIFGMTGSGKSTTLAIIAYEMQKSGIPSLILDRTGEFKNKFIKVPGVHYYLPGYNLNISPFKIWEEEAEEERIHRYLWLLEEFCRITWKESFSPLQTRLIAQSLERLIGRDDMDFSMLIEECRKIAKDELKIWFEAAEAIASRFSIFTVGKFRKAFNETSNSTISEVFQEGIHVIDLSNLEYDAPKNLFSLIIANLVMLKIKKNSFSRKLNLAFMIDEAHNIAGKEIKYSLMEKISMELRKYGLSLIIASPNPSEINPNILANSGVLIAHQMLSIEEAETIKKYSYPSSYFSTFEDVVCNLKTGEAFIRAPSRLEGEVVKIGVKEHSILTI
ncbi:MAG TPA: ATP-binding protein [Geobacterales bacterium]|nr:ATP-binding protein [Geobacterales bacterium]